MIKTFTIWVRVYNSCGAWMFYGGRDFPHAAKKSGASSRHHTLGYNEGQQSVSGCPCGQAASVSNMWPDWLHAVLFPLIYPRKYRRVCGSWKPRPGLEEFGRLGLVTLHEDLWRVEGFEKPMSFVTTKCWYSQSLQVDGRCKASTCWRRRSSVEVFAPLAVGQGAPQAIIRCMYVCHAGHYEGLRGAEQMSACG